MSWNLRWWNSKTLAVISSGLRHSGGRSVKLGQNKFLDLRRHSREGWVVEDQEQGKLHTEAFADARQQLRSQQGVSAQKKEIVIRAHAIHMKQRRNQFG